MAPSGTADPPFKGDGRDNRIFADAIVTTADAPEARGVQDVSYGVSNFWDVQEVSPPSPAVSFQLSVHFTCQATSQFSGRESDRNHFAVPEQASQAASKSQAVAEIQAGSSQTGVVDEVVVNSQVVNTQEVKFEFEFNGAGPTRQLREHASYVVVDLTSL